MIYNGDNPKCSTQIDGPVAWQWPKRRGYTYRVGQSKCPRVALDNLSAGALFGHCTCSSCGFSSNFASLGRFYEFERSPLCAGTGDDPKGYAALVTNG